MVEAANTDAVIAAIAAGSAVNMNTVSLVTFDSVVLCFVLFCVCNINVFQKVREFIYDENDAMSRVTLSSFEVRN